MSQAISSYGDTQNTDTTISLKNLRFVTFATRNLVFLIAILAMNYTLMRPSPVDLLFIGSLLITLFHLTLFRTKLVTRRSIHLILILGAWAVSYFIASLPHIGEEFVAFELLAKSFAISIGVIGGVVSMSWSRRHFETFMKVYIVSCVIASILGTAGFLIQHPLLTWDGRAKGLIDDPNMYGSFLIPALMFCAYLVPRTRSGRWFVLGAMGIILLGILLSFSRIAIVAALLCIFAYIFYQNRRSPRRLLMIVGGLLAAGLALFVIASLTSADFTEKLLDRLTFAKAYDLGEDGRYGRYLQVVPMIVQDPIGLGVIQLEKIFPEPIHNIWLSSFVNYGWGGGIAWVTLAVGSVIVSLRNYRQTQDPIVIVLLWSLIGIVLCASLHEGEHWRHMWLMFGLIWGLNISNAGFGTRSRARRGQDRMRPMSQTPTMTTVTATRIQNRTSKATAPRIAPSASQKPTVPISRARRMMTSMGI
ncbi:O-antigen ligase family protein [Pelagibacterium lacus]|uniref:O-antigen ligase domain-containing protein n=1 Tax=Pelagibacterium lacus TaxID=2282655 RepID=A0A369W2R3_9HYPH|nr:O-antigen ligase family protein [Pelagibacterium lacus]RDE08964.1 O-antigen ligase domain-containing protein [Pelagibacterium lacus]